MSRLTHQINIRLTPNERELMLKLSTTTGRSQSEIVRDALMALDAVISGKVCLECVKTLADHKPEEWR